MVPAWLVLLSLNTLSLAQGWVPAPTARREELSGVAQDSEEAAAAPSPEDAKAQAPRGFDWTSVGATPVPVKEWKKPPKTEPKGLKPSKPSIVVGRSHWMREPKNPLTPDGKPKPRGIGFFMKLLWSLAGAIVGGGIGFLLGGPIGAAVGAAVGAGGAWFLAPKM